MGSGRLHVGEGVAGEGGLGDDAGEGELFVGRKRMEKRRGGTEYVCF